MMMEDAEALMELQDLGNQLNELDGLISPAAAAGAGQPFDAAAVLALPAAWVPSIPANPMLRATESAAAAAMSAGTEPLIPMALLLVASVRGPVRSGASCSCAF